MKVRGREWDREREEGRERGRGRGREKGGEREGGEGERETIMFKVLSCQ